MSLTNQQDWDPHCYNGFISEVNTDDAVYNTNEMLSIDPILSILNCDYISYLVDDVAVLPGIGHLGDDYDTISEVQSSKKNKLQPSDLEKLWNIGLKMAQRTLSSTTHKCICRTGMLS